MVKMTPPWKGRKTPKVGVILDEKNDIFDTQNGDIAVQFGLSYHPKMTKKVRKMQKSDFLTPPWTPTPFLGFRSGPPFFRQKRQKC